MEARKKICVFLPNWIGDVVMATPAFLRLREAFGPDATLTAVGRPHVLQLLYGSKIFDCLRPYDPKSAARELKRLSLIGFLRKEGFDGIVLLSNSFSTAFIAWLGNSRTRIGYAMHWRSPLLSHRLKPEMKGKRMQPAPMLELYLAIAEESIRAISGKSDGNSSPPDKPVSRRLRLYTTDEEERLGDAIWNNLGLKPPQRVIAINVGGAFGSAKRWEPEPAAELASLIVDRLDYDALIICGPGEKADADKIAALANRKRVFSLANQPLGISATKICLKRAVLTVSTDSGPRHIAAAFGNPVITLLGPTLAKWIENPCVQGSFVSLGLDCSGCAKRTCPLEHNRCMKELTAHTVFDEMLKFLPENTTKQDM